MNLSVKALLTAALMMVGPATDVAAHNSVTFQAEAHAARRAKLTKTLKYEEVYAYDYESIHYVVQRLPKFIDEIDNRQRLHSALGYCTPEEYKMNYARRQVKG